MARSSKHPVSRPHAPPRAWVAAAALLVGASASLAAQDASPASAQAYAPAPGEPTLEAMRTSALRFQDVEVALAEGYVQDPTGMCVTAEMEGLPAELGAMGIHYFRPDLLGITATAPRVVGTGTHLDFLRPAILLYEPQADGSLELVAVENLVFEEAWLAAGHDGPPTFHGHPFEHMVDDPATPDVDESHGFAPHFDQHVHLFRENPLGTLEPFNPAISCDQHAAYLAARGVGTRER